MTRVTLKAQHFADYRSFEMHASQRALAASARAVSEMTEAAKEKVDLGNDSRVEDLCIALSGRKVNPEVKAAVSEKLPVLISRLVADRINETASIIFDEDLHNAYEDLLKTSHRSW